MDLVDFLAIGSVVGIWPRYIEPLRLCTTELIWELDATSAHLDGLKIVHLTDLHFHRKISEKFLQKVIHRLNEIQPALLLFTGDFLCYSILEQPDRFTSFLNHLQAPLGSYCTFGNHDYARYVSLNRSGVYDQIPPPYPLTGLFRGLYTLCSSHKASAHVAERVLKIPLHDELCSVLKKTPFKLLDNCTTTLPIGLNLTGLGDMALGRCCPELAFANFDARFPGIVLSHNPDSFPNLLAYPGEWILSGHTHGEQIHIPWPRWGRNISQRLTRLQNKEYTRGLFAVGHHKHLYVNRGLGCHKPFRLFSPPEICIIKARQ